MLLRITADLSFDLVNKDQFDKLKNYLATLISKAVNVNEGQENQEISYIEARKSNHDDPTRTIPDEIIGRWEVGKGRVI